MFLLLIIPKYHTSSKAKMDIHHLPEIFLGKNKNKKKLFLWNAFVVLCIIHLAVIIDYIPMFFFFMCSQFVSTNIEEALWGEEPRWDSSVYDINMRMFCKGNGLYIAFQLWNWSMVVKSSVQTQKSLIHILHLQTAFLKWLCLFL